MAIDKEKIQKEGIKILEEFSEQLKNLPETKETHYVLDIKNILREDKECVLKKNFREKLKRIAPRVEENYIVAEKGI
ncbi:MAG: Asp-tRNA(Asn) amidotransferase subunit GatC [Candidatus Altiarchaeota archaeon]